MDKHLICEPSVFVAGDSYDIIFLTYVKGLAWVIVGNEKVCDSDNGNIKSEEIVHKIKVSKEVLDNAGGYTVYFTPVIKRRPYFPLSGETVSKTYKFYPVQKKSEYNYYMISDTHSVPWYAQKSGKFFGDKLDFLILNGDIADKSKDVENISTLHVIASEITKGELPVIFARGNHDTRGELAPELSKFTPVHDGNTYFTFNLGNIWGIVLDCGEDKTDEHKEYGGMADFENFRSKETEFLKKVAESHEYDKYEIKICICHVKFFKENGAASPETYKKWMTLINKIGIDIMLCGHEHAYYVTEKGSWAYEDVVAEFPVVVGSRCTGNMYTNYSELPPDFIGTAVTQKAGKINIKFTDSNQNIIEEHTL